MWKNNIIHICIYIYVHILLYIILYIDNDSHKKHQVQSMYKYLYIKYKTSLLVFSSSPAVQPIWTWVWWLCWMLVQEIWIQESILSTGSTDWRSTVAKEPYISNKIVSFDSWNKKTNIIIIIKYHKTCVYWLYNIQFLAGDQWPLFQTRHSTSSSITDFQAPCSWGHGSTLTPQQIMEIMNQLM
jgi:hypothetical protein